MSSNCCEQNNSYIVLLTLRLIGFIYFIFKITCYHNFAGKLGLFLNVLKTFNYFQTFIFHFLGKS